MVEAASESDEAGSSDEEASDGEVKLRGEAVLESGAVMLEPRVRLRRFKVGSSKEGMTVDAGMKCLRGSRSKPEGYRKGKKCDLGVRLDTAELRV